MTIDFNIMAKVQKIINTELYAALCEYIDYLEDAAYHEGYDNGYNSEEGQ